MPNAFEENSTNVDIGEEDDEEEQKKDETREPIYMMGSVSHSYIQYNDHTINLLQSKSSGDDHPVVPASIRDKMCFLAYYTCSVAKLHLIFITPVFFKEAIWTFVVKTCMATLPYHFIDLFYCVYAPRQHLYIAQMVPLLCGSTIQNLICSLISMTLNSDLLIRLLAYNVNGIIYRFSWEQCSGDIFSINHNGTTYPVDCLSIDEFNDMPKVNMTISHKDGVYYTNINDSYNFFAPRQMLYYALIDHEFNSTPFYKINVIFYHIFIWAFLPLFRGQLYKKIIWRVFNWLLCTMSVIYLFTIISIEIAFVVEDMAVEDLPAVDNNKLWLMSQYAIEKLPGITTAPPIVHFLYARSNEEVKPGRHSAILSVSNVLFYILQGLAHQETKKYVEAKTGIEIQVGFENQYSLFYMCPLLCSNWAIGPLLIKIFFFVLFLVEYLLLVMTYQTIIEVALAEFKKLNYWMFAVPLALTAFLFAGNTNLWTRVEHYCLSTILASFTKLVAIVWIYPTGRLIEDIDFYYYSDRVTKLRRFFINMLPFVFLFFCLAYVFWWTWTLFLIYMSPVIIGAIFVIFLSIYKKKGWTYTLRPLATWGPQEFEIRYFRKKFNTSKFIDSISERCLSRHMLQRAEPSYYRLGVQYLNVRRRLHPDTLS